MHQNPEIAQRIRIGTFDSNVHDPGNGSPVLLIQGSGPGGRAGAN